MTNLLELLLAITTLGACLSILVYLLWQARTPVTDDQVAWAYQRVTGIHAHVEWQRADDGSIGAWTADGPAIVLTADEL